MSHDLVDLAVLLAAHKLLVLVGKLNLDPNLILGLGDKGGLREIIQSPLDRVIGAGDVESHLVKDQISSRRVADFFQYGPDVDGPGKLSCLWVLYIPPGGVELAGLQSVSTDSGLVERA